MKSTIAIAALIGVAFAASSAFAQNSAPGSTLPKPKAAVMPPPPPPGGPDKLVTRTQPPGTPGAGPRTPHGPGVVDDFAGGPKHSPAHGGSTCGAEAGTGVANPTCVASLDAMCGTKDHPGGMRTNDDGSVTCAPAN